MLGFDALASLPLASIPSVSGNVTLDGAAGSLVFTGQDATTSIGYVTDGVAGELVFTGQDATISVSGVGTRGYPKPVRYTVKVNGQLVTGSYEDIQSIVQQLAEQDAKEAAAEVIEQAKKPRRAKFLRVVPAKAKEPEAEVIQAKPLVVEYEQAYQAFLQNLLIQAADRAQRAEADDEEVLLMLL